MYRISSTNNWFHGEKFASLAAAVKRANEIVAKGYTADVVIDADRDTFRAVYTPNNCKAGRAIRGTYERNPKPY